MSKIKYRLILASQSPRRKELMEQLGPAMEIINPDVEEVSSFTAPAQIVEDLAQLKGRAVMNLCQKRAGFGSQFWPVIVAADTMVALGDRIFGKPKDLDEAKEMLLALSGRTHQVLTGTYIGLFDQNTHQLREKTFVCSSYVTFDHLTQDILERYLDTRECLDKAGAYGIQGAALTFISNVEGSYSNVVGLPLSDVVRELKALLSANDDEVGLWRSQFWESQ